MSEVLQNIDLVALITAVWTIVCIPIGKEVRAWLKEMKLDKYAKILYDEIKKAVKAVYQDVVDDIKGTDAWTDEKKAEVRELAKQKALQALSVSAYKMLKASNDDFEVWLDNMISTALYDVKNEK